MVSQGIAHGGTTACSHRCCRFYFRNLFHARVLSGLLPGKGPLLLSLLKESEQGYRARKVPVHVKILQSLGVVGCDLQPILKARRERKTHSAELGSAGASGMNMEGVSRWVMGQMLIYEALVLLTGT